MRNLCFLILLLLTFALNAQERFEFKNTPLTQIIADLEDRFDIRFSYKSNLLEGQNFTYNKSAKLKDFLNAISEEKNIEFIFLGKENVVIKSSFDLAFDANALEEVVLVSEYLTAGFDQNKKDGSVTLNPNKLGALPGLTDPDVLQSLQLLPGISSPTESASNLHIRGGTPDQNLILYDGIKIYHQGHMFGMISPFNPYIVENVNVFRSGTKAQFGDRIAGVIDINSLDEVPKEISGGAGFNFLHADAYIKAPIQKDKVGWVFSARRSINDIANLPTFNSFSDKVFQNTKIEFVNDGVIEEELKVIDDQFTFLDVNAKLIVTPDDFNKISISGLLVDNSLNYANVDFENNGTRDRLDLTNSGISAQWKYNPQGDWNLDATLHYSAFDSEYDFTDIENGGNGDFFNSINAVRDLGIQVQAGYSFNESVKAFLGYEFVNYDVSYLFSFNDEGAVENEDFNSNLSGHNLYAEGQFKLNDFFLRGGFRATSYVGTNQRFFEPRLYADYQVSDAFKLKASAEIKNQAISQILSFEFNDLQLAETTWVLFNDEEGVPVLNNRQFTFGFFLNKSGWKLDVEGYYKRVTGLTSFTRGFGSNSTTSGDDFYVGNSTVRGVDVLLKKKVNRFRTWLGYSYSKNDFEFPEVQSGSFPGNFDQRHILSWSGSYKYKQFQFSLGWQFTTGRPYTEATGSANGDLVFGRQNATRLANYHKLDLSGFYDFYLDPNNQVKARLGLSVINLYNRDNVIDRNFFIDEGDDDNNSLIERSNVGLGITPNLVFRVYF
jgi:outer membrane cobalamin receptor